MIYENEINEKKDEQLKIENIEYIGEKYSKDIKSHKVIFLGLSGVGKTSITLQIINKFCNTSPTISVVLQIIKLK